MAIHYTETCGRCGASFAAGNVHLEQTLYKLIDDFRQNHSCIRIRHDKELKREKLGKVENGQTRL